MNNIHKYVKVSKYKKLLVILPFIIGCMAISAEAQTSIKQNLAQIIKDAKVPGLQVMHVKNGVSKTYVIGEKKYESGNKVIPATLFQACSLSKSVMAYIALILYDRGVLELDTPLQQYWVYSRLSEEPEGKNITARMVLSHTTGLPNWSDSDDGKLHVAFKPGTDYRYSGEGYLYLQKVLEHVTGKSLEELATELVFKPLGMKRSHFIYLDKMKEDYAHGHDDLDPDPLRKYKNANAAYSLITNAADYTAFVQKALIKGEGLKSKTHTMMLSFFSSRYPRIGNGLGVQIQHNAKGKAIFHNGSNPGFRCFYLAYPATGESVVCFTNGSNGSKIREEVSKLFYGDLKFWGL